MITVCSSMLIPGSVVNGKFPLADEDKLKALGSHWTSVGTTLGSQGDSATTLSRTVFANWSGAGADTASAQITAVTRFASATRSATAVMSAGCAKAAAFVTNTKNGINAVLRQLDNMTKEQIAIGLTNPIMIPVCVRNIVNLPSLPAHPQPTTAEAEVGVEAARRRRVRRRPWRPRPSRAASRSASSLRHEVDTPRTQVARRAVATPAATPRVRQVAAAGPRSSTSRSVQVPRAPPLRPR